MTAFEILLVIIGLILFGGSFFVSEKITATKEQLKVAIDENELKKLLQSQIKDMDEELTQIIVDNIENSTDEVKRSMEKLSNEKIMAIDEYSTTVMESIHKSHNEVLFLYGMLNDKKAEIKETADLINKANKGINKKLAEALELIEKMDSQILFLNQYSDKQNVTLDKMEKSTHAIEVLEEQLHKIEQMALQFSSDRNLVEDKLSKQVATKINEKSHEVRVKQASGIGLKDTNAMDNNFEKNENENSENGIEEISENISKDSHIPEDEKKDASNNNNKIIEMSKKGQSALDIARTLGLGVGEVQLVIDLFVGGKQ